MALTKAQLMEIPGGPGGVGAVEEGSGLTINASGVISIDPTSNTTTITAGTGGLTVTPDPGVGSVTIDAPVVPPPPVSFPAGSVTAFAEAAAPTGWTKVTTTDNAAIRIVSGVGGGTGGTQNYSTAMVSSAPPATMNYSTVTWTTAGLGATALTLAQLSSHAHTFQVRGQPNPATWSTVAQSGTIARNPPTTTSPAGSGSPHTHPLSGNLTGTDPVTLSQVQLSVRYLDLIIATKN